MKNFKIERIYLRKLQLIAERYNYTLNTIINQALEVTIHNYEKENGVMVIDYDKLDDEGNAEVLEEAEYNREKECIK